MSSPVLLVTAWFSPEPEGFLQSHAIKTGSSAKSEGIGCRRRINAMNGKLAGP